MESNLLLVFGVLLVTACTQCEGQKVTTSRILSTRNYTCAKEGTNVTVICEVNNLAGKTVRWIHDDEPVALMANGNREFFIKLNGEKKYSLLGAQTSGGNFTFTIHNISHDDVGKVTCVADDAIPATNLIYLFDAPDTVQLTFISNESTFENRQPELPVLHVSNNEWVNLTCTAINSCPDAVLTWYWNDTNIFSKWNHFAETSVSEIDGVFNTSSVLNLPPGFSTTLFENPLFNTITAKEGLSLNLTTAFPSTNPTSQCTTKFISNDRTANLFLTDGLLPKKIKADLLVKITCKAAFQDEVVNQSLQVHVGPYSGGGSLIQTHEVMWMVYVCAYMVFC